MATHKHETIEQPGATRRRLTDPAKPSAAHHLPSRSGEGSPHPTNVALPSKPRPANAGERKSSAKR